ncbi:WD40/YVTN/BNR-like repeat-containing protein [Marinicrinis sediminis]|uniref:WD40/YVTN/BNR-like repeat-containing protein n=1 Tax=Marinicrinis sediminis TaxID=1652465 RepID=A0ABW5R7N4_9BACL
MKNVHTALILLLLLVLATGCNLAEDDEHKLVTDTSQDMDISNYNLAFYDEQTGWLYGQNGTELHKFNLLKTSNKGKDWVNAMPMGEDFHFAHSEGDVLHHTNVFFLSSEVFWIIQSTPNEITVFKTSDGGQSWENGETWNPKTAGLLTDIYFVNETKGWLMIDVKQGADYVLRECYITEDGGSHWELISSYQDHSFPSDHLQASSVFIDNQTGFIPVINTEQPMFYQTVNGGADWSKVELPYPANDSNMRFNIESIRFFDTDTGIVLLSTVKSDNIMKYDYYVTKDKGVTWTLHEGVQIKRASQDSNIGSKIVTPNYAWTIDDRVLYRYNILSSEQFKTIQIKNITGNDDPGQKITGYSFVDESVGWVIVYDNGKSTIYKTVDSGDEWTDFQIKFAS